MNYIIKDGFWSKFKPGRKFKGLHLNRVIRDVLRECGIPCPTCNEGNCNEPMIKLVTSNPVEYINAAGDKMTATVISLPRYADAAAAQADNYPINGWYINTTTGTVSVVV